jgi:hypothetical protein
MGLQDVHACECAVTSHVINELAIVVSSSWMFFWSFVCCIKKNRNSHYWFSLCFSINILPFLQYDYSRRNWTFIFSWILNDDTRLLIELLHLFLLYFNICENKDILFGTIKSWKQAKCKSLASVTVFQFLHRALVY